MLPPGKDADADHHDDYRRRDDVAGISRPQPQQIFAPQLVGTLGLHRTFFEGGGIEAASTAFTVGAKYYITAPRAQGVAPFLDAAIGVAKTDNGRDNSTDFTWEFGGGVSWFFTEATSFDAALRLFHTDTDIETKGTRIFVGITTRF